MAGLSTLPAELVDLIFSFLPLRDQKSLSLCSKALREINLPTLFESIQINPESYKALSPGGRLSSIQSRIRYANLKPSSEQYPASLTPPEFCIVIKSYMNYLDLLKTATKLRGVGIAAPPLPETLNDDIYRAIIAALSTYPSFKNIKRIAIQRAPGWDVNPNLGNQIENSAYTDSLDHECAEFIENGSKISWKLGKLFEERQFNPEILSLNASVLHTFELPDSEGVYKEANVAEQLFRLFRGTVTSLDIFTGVILRPRFSHGFYMCRNVTYLHFHPRTLLEHYIDVVVLVFPNVEELVVWGNDMENFMVTQRDSIAYRTISHISRLKRVFLPRPTAADYRIMSRTQLQSMMEYWLGEGVHPRSGERKSSPLSMLEYAELGSSDHGSLGCRVLRRADGRVASLEWRGIDREEPYWIRREDDRTLPLTGKPLHPKGYEALRDMLFEHEGVESSELSGGFDERVP